MKVSIITATYNSSKNISTAISSISNQDYSNIEWIVIDGNSSDKTVELIKNNFKGDLKLISEKDAGIYDALNKGVQTATGNIIGFVHSDDFLASENILSKISSIFNNEDVDGIYGDLKYVDKEDTSKVIRYWKSQSFKPELLGKGWMPAHPTLFLRKEVYQKYGLFNLDYKIAADYDFLLRIFRDKSLKFYYLPEVITKMRLGGASNSSIKNMLKKSGEDYQALKKNNIKNPLKALILKNLSKVSQFISK